MRAISLSPELPVAGKEVTPDTNIKKQKILLRKQA
jgi:hypothetical protein